MCTTSQTAEHNERHGILPHLIQLIETIYQEQQAVIKITVELSNWFEVQRGIRQDCILFLYLFNIHAENMRNIKNYESCDTFDSFNVTGNQISELIYANDTVVISNDPRGLEQLIQSEKAQ